MEDIKVMNISDMNNLYNVKDVILLGEIIERKKISIDTR